MWPRTWWSLSSLTLNIVLGRASVTSPSISIFSSFPTRQGYPARLTPPLASLEGGVAGPLLEERAHGVLKVLGLEQRGCHLRRLAVGLVHPILQVGADDPLRRRVRLGRPGGEAVGELH